MKSKIWFIVCMCVLLPLESIAANNSHCAKMADAVVMNQMNNISGQDHCKHSAAQHHTEKSQNMQKDCGVCNAHSVSLFITVTNLTEVPELSSQSSNIFLETLTLSPFIALPYKPPQILSA